MNWPLLHEMQFVAHVHADPILVPFVVLRLVQAIGVYGMQFKPSADS